MKKEYEEYSRKFKIGDVVRVAYTTTDDEEEWLNNVGMIERTDDFGNFNYCVDFEGDEVWFNEASLDEIRITKPSDYEDEYEVGDRVVVDRVTEDDYLDKNWRTLGKEGVVKEKAPFYKSHYHIAFDDGTSAWVNYATLKLIEKNERAEELPDPNHFDHVHEPEAFARESDDLLTRATDYLARGNVYEWLEDELSCSIAVRLDMEDYEGVEKGAALLNELKRKAGDPLD